MYKKMYKKVKIWGFIPWFEPATLAEMKVSVSTMEMADLYVRSTRHLVGVLKSRPVTTSDKPAQFIVEGYDDAKQN